MVVVVEDDRPLARPDHRLSLEGAGVQVVAARDGAEGLAAVRRHHPAAVVLDIRLPRHGRLGRARGAQGGPGHRVHSRVVVVTILDERAQALALGAADIPRSSRSVATRCSPPSAASALFRPTSAPTRHHARGTGMSAATILVVEDNEKNLKLVRDVLQYAGLRRGRGRVRRARCRDGHRASTGPGPDGPPAAGHGRHRGAAPATRLPAHQLGAGRGRHRVRDEGRPRTGVRTPASTVTSRNRSACKRCLRRCEASCLPRTVSTVSDRPDTVLVVDDLPQNVRLLDAVLSPRGYQGRRRRTPARRRWRSCARSRPTSCCSTS